MMTPKSNNTQIYLNIANFKIRIDFITNPEANQYIKLDNLRKTIIRILNPYVDSEQNKTDFTILITYDLNKFYKKTMQDKVQYLTEQFSYFKKTNTIQTYWHISINQFIMILTMVLDLLTSKNGNGCFFHCSSVIYNKAAYLFTGPSGIGKSTIASLLKNKAQVFCDDVLVIRKEKNIFKAYQIPVLEKIKNKSVKNNRGYKIKAIYILKKSKILKLKKLSQYKKYYTLLSQVWSGIRVTSNHIKFIKDLVKNLENIYVLESNKNKQRIMRILKIV